MADKDKVIVGLTSEIINVQQQMEDVSDPGCGAISSFLGVTRNNFNGKVVLLLEYECYETMALKKMKEIGHQALEKWEGIHKISIIHRLGKVPVKEASISIVVSSPHRLESLEAVHWLIDELKAVVPIWKKEHYEDGTQWKENTEWIGKGRKKACCSHDRSPVSPPSSSQ
uniref:Molybdopterin synthase catalytic subunit n=1 Tax=Paramoeba aestuarina TaxID=180227 RepID=A0A7S4NT59_9EUKA|mmetsp:Transcript_26488/g.41238  ORF Transcript_26488/g.41238 Transcript_26488/m.41238 type:complete len:170 (+) Transcript_26488:315-824(+)